MVLRWITKRRLMFQYFNIFTNFKLKIGTKTKRERVPHLHKLKKQITTTVRTENHQNHIRFRRLFRNNHTLKSSEITKCVGPHRSQPLDWSFATKFRPSDRRGESHHRFAYSGLSTCKKKWTNVIDAIFYMVFDIDRFPRRLWIII